jgi:ribonuclease BN (tRNA processing enzyme)
MQASASRRGPSRRELLSGSLALGGLALLGREDVARARSAPAAPARAAQSGTRLILLGTAGGPRLTRSRSSPAQVIVIGDIPYVVDCGSGVARQLVFAGVPLHTLRHVFITHHHSDHNADYGNLLYLAWIAGLRTPVDAHGPSPLAEMTALFLRMNAHDIDIRIADEARVPLQPLIRPHELAGPGVVLEDERVRVTAALVDHPPMVPAFAYRFDTVDRSIVLSGDTAASDNLIRLAAGADVLVHEVYDPAGAERLAARTPNPAVLLEHIAASHTTAEDVGRVARAAGVKTVVLSHFVPSEDPLMTDEVWRQGVQVHFDGDVIPGRDLLEV